MGRTYYLRDLEKKLEICTRTTRYKSIMDRRDARLTDTRRTKRFRLKSDVSRKFAENDIQGAEKGLLKMLRKNPCDAYAISQLISMYAKEGRFDDGKKLIESALRREISECAVYSSAICLYSAAGEPGKAREVFDTAVTKSSANAAVYHSMLSIYTNAGFLEKAETIFRQAVQNGSGSFFVYITMADFYYGRGMYEEVRETIESVPPFLKNSPRFVLLQVEVDRKLKNYEKAISGVDEFIAGYRNRSFSDDNYVHARTIKAYCLMHSRSRGEALPEFAILRNQAGRKSVHYPRILCGYVFCRPELTEKERKDVLEELVSLSPSVSDSMRDKVEKAAQLLSRDGQPKT